MYRKMAEYYEVIFPETQKISFLQELFSKAKLLDLGCATGAVARGLAKEGCVLDAIDLSQEMIQQAKRSSSSVCFSIGNIVQERKENEYDGAYCLGNTIAHLKPKELERAFSSWHKMIKTQGILVIQTLNYNYILKKKMKRLPDISRENIHFERYYDYQNSSILFTTKLYEKDHLVYEDAVTLYGHRQEDIIAQAKKAGFYVQAIYSSYQKDPAHVEKIPLIIVFKNQ